MLYVFIVIGVIFLIFSFVSSLDDNWPASIIGLIVGLAMGVSSICGIVTINDRIDTYERLEEKQEIVSLKDNNSQISGGGNLFYVSINTEGVYTYYYKLDDGGYKRGQVTDDNTVIYEEDNCENPSVQRYESYTQNNWNQTWTKILLFSSKQDEWKSSSTRYEIHVPKGTIVQEFTLDAET